MRVLKPKMAEIQINTDIFLPKLTDTTEHTDKFRQVSWASGQGPKLHAGISMVIVLRHYTKPLHLGVFRVFSATPSYRNHYGAF